MDVAPPEETEEGKGGGNIVNILSTELIFYFIVGQEQKGGVQITPYLRFGSIKDENFVPAGVSKHMKKRWTCDKCNQSFMFNLDEIIEHRKTCGAAEKQDEGVDYLAQQEKLYPHSDSFLDSI